MSVLLIFAKASSTVTSGSLICYNIHKSTLLWFIFLNFRIPRVLNISIYKNTLIVPCEIQTGFKPVFPTLLKSISSHMVPWRTLPIPNLSLQNLLRRELFCVPVIMPFYNFLQAVHQSYFPRNRPVLTLQY